MSLVAPALLEKELPRGRNSGPVLAISAAFASLFSIVGLALWGLPFYYDFMVRQFGWSHAQVTSGNAYSKIAVGLVFGAIAGWMVDRFGPRRLMMAGIVMAGAALVGLGYISTLTGFYFFYIFNALGYVCGGPLPNQVLLSRWFDQARGKAMGFAYLGISLGAAAVPWISSVLAHRFGWQVALRILGGLIILLSLPIAFLVKDAPEDWQPERTPAPDSTAVRGAFKTIAFYLLAVGSMCSIAAVSGAQQNLKLYLSLDEHFSQFEAARIVSLVFTFSIIGRLLMGWLADHFPKKWVMLLIYVLVACAIPLLFLARIKGGAYIFAVIFGIGLGGDYMIIPLMTAEIFGVRILGRLMGVLLMADSLAEAISPLVVGHLRDLSGNYRNGFLLLVAMALLGAVAVAALPRRRLTT